MTQQPKVQDLPTRLQKYCEMHRNDPEPIPIPMKEKMGKKKLVGGQKKLDTDNDGDIDAKDLKRLRKKPKKSKGRGFTR